MVVILLSPRAHLLDHAEGPRPGTAHPLRAGGHLHRLLHLKLAATKLGLPIWTKKDTMLDIHRLAHINSRRGLLLWIGPGLLLSVLLHVGWDKLC